MTKYLAAEGSLSGTWYNQLGSKMTLNHSLDGTLFGTYHTEVERRLGSAGGVQTLHGRVGQDYPTTLGFTVTFKVRGTADRGSCFTCRSYDEITSRHLGNWSVPDISIPERAQRTLKGSSHR